LSALPVPIQIGFLILLFFAGFIGRRVGWLTPAHAGRMLQLVMTVGLPALFIADVSRAPLHRALAALPISAILIMLVTMGTAGFIGRRLQLPRATHGAFVLCSTLMNPSFLYPFVIAAWGRDAFAMLALFDLGNTLMLGTAIYAIAATYGGHATGFVAILKRVLSFPPLWALVAALALNLSDTQLPAIVTTVLGTAGRLILLLVIPALGVLFDVRLLRSRLLVAALALRIPLGLALGLACAALFGLTGLARAVLLLGAAAPIGFSAVVIANRESLDRDLAASAASISVLLALVYVPLALWLL
jgi:predicted permease